MNTPMTVADLKEKIATLPPNGWWHPHNGEAMVNLGERLVRYGLSPGRAYEILSAAYGIVADEYGEEIDLRVRVDIRAPRNELGEPCPWPWEPQQLKGAPMGQYHCSYCGGMNVAGVSHLNWTAEDIREMEGR